MAAELDWSIALLEPWWLLLLAALPLVVWQSVASLSALGPIRRWVAIAVRSIVLALLILALADLQIVRRTREFCTLFVVDQSLSIPEDRSSRALDLVEKAIANRPRDTDQVGLVVFGKEARIELPPTQYPRSRQVRGVGSRLDREYSNPASGLKLALGSFPADCINRIVLISDGNQNQGNALAQAAAAEPLDVPIDVVPIEYRYDSEVLVDKVVLPPNLKKGDTANLKIVMRSRRPTSGKLRLLRVADGRSHTVHEEPVVLDEPLKVLFLKQTIDEPDFYTYEAQFEPDPDSGDRLARNNQASAFTFIRGEGKVLLIESKANEHARLVEKLRQDNLLVIVRSAEQAARWKSLAELRQFDTIIIGNVPSEDLPEELQELLAASTRELGTGLIMIGGPDSFGAGGYIGTPIEKALPVEMEVKSTKVRTKGALVLIMHACEIPEGNFWQKRIGKLAIQTLGSQDECGLLAWNGRTSWIFPVQPVGDRQRMNARIDTMAPGDMPDFEPSMRMALNALQSVQASTKHVIIISDGDPQPASDGILQAYRDAKLTCTTVAVAAHGAAELGQMRRIARGTGGRNYNATNPNLLPQIYIKETRIVSRPLVFEQDPPWQPIIHLPTEPLAGLPQQLPTIRGFVLTTPKSTAEVAVISPIPGDNEVNPILAHWQYGLGKAVAFTSDAGQRWAVGWPGTELFAKFWSQLVRWSMRADETEDLTVSTQEQDGRVTVVVNALDKASEYLNFLPLTSTLIGPDAKARSLDFKQTEPGKYEAEFQAEQFGSYFLRIGYQRPDGKQGFVSTGVNVSYPPEYRDLESNRDLLENVAALSNGRVLEWDKLNDADLFPRDREARLRLQDAWPLLLLIALGTFLFDVAVRRISIDPADIARWCSNAWAWIRQRPLTAPAAATMERLRSKKHEVARDLEAKRFEPSPAVDPLPSVIDERPVPGPPRPAAPSPPVPAPEKSADEYTSRLLQAKKKVWQERDEKPDS